MSIDQRNQLSENPFSYKITKEKVMIYRNNKVIKILKGIKASELITKLNGKSEMDVQLILAKVTGHYKH